MVRPKSNSPSPAQRSLRAGAQKQILFNINDLLNVLLPEEKPYVEIPDWRAKFDVAILQFKPTALTEAANPVKAYEILASGKPLVSVPLPEMRPLAQLARLASTVVEFEQAIQAEISPGQPDGGTQKTRVRSKQYLGEALPTTLDGSAAFAREAWRLFARIH
jgi:hypothetical protein